MNNPELLLDEDMQLFDLLSPTIMFVALVPLLQVLMALLSRPPIVLPPLGNFVSDRRDPDDISLWHTADRPHAHFTLCQQLFSGTT